MTENYIKEKVDKADAEIMDWVYELARINFDVEGWVQDSTELRNILEAFLSEAIQYERRKVREIAEGMKQNAVNIMEVATLNAFLSKLDESDK